jgi:hypothetical protein
MNLYLYFLLVAMLCHNILQCICFFIAFPVKCMSIFWKEMIAGSDLSEQYAGKLKASYSTSSVRICRAKEMNISFN